MKNIIGLKEFRQNTDNWINQVNKGKSFVVVRKSKPVFKMVPVDQEDSWEAVADFTLIKKDGISAREILKELKKLNA